MNIHIDASVCSGHGRCYSLVPDLFSPDDDGHGTSITGDVPPDREQDAQLALQNCPEQAISLG